MKSSEKTVGMRLIIVRHGETEANAAGLVQGQSDTSLSGRGRRQAADLARRLQGEHIDFVYSSPEQPK